MSNKKFIISALLILALIVSLSACKKADTLSVAAPANEEFAQSGIKSMKMIFTFENEVVSGLRMVIEADSPENALAIYETLSGENNGKLEESVISYDMDFSAYDLYTKDHIRAVMSEMGYTIDE